MLTSEQIAQGWKEHDGGPCPVAGDTMVDFVMRCETFENYRPVSEKASCVDWLWADASGDIIACREVPHD